jgi:hypothetical protein
MTIKLSVYKNFFSNLIDKLKIFLNSLNIFNLSILLSLLVLAINPAITEHVEFALVANSDIKISEFNHHFHVRMLDPSSQVSFVQLLLNLNLGTNIAQIIVSFIVTLIPIFAILNLFKLIDSPQKYSNEALLVFFLTLFHSSNPINAALYPWSPRINFFEFGNQGMWLSLGALILLIKNRKSGYLLSGILFSWHMVWFLPILLYLSLNYEKIEKKNLLFLFMGLAISLLFLQYGRSDLTNFLQAHALEFNKINFAYLNLQSIRVTDSIWSGHNPLIFGKSTNFHYLLVVSIPIISLNYLNLQKQLLRFCNYLFLITLLVILYLEIARYYPLPFANVLFRAIANRFFNLIMAIFIYYLFFFCINFKDYKKKINDYFLIITLVISVLFYFNVSHILRFALFICLYNYYNKKIKYLDIFLILIFSFSLAAKHHKNMDYNIFSFLYPNKIENFITNEGKGKSYILSGGIQSFKGLNITNLAKAEYFSPTPPLTIGNKHLDLYCYESLSLNSKRTPSYVWNIDKCFENKSERDWREIFNLTGASFVIVSDKVKLDLNLILESEGLRIYSNKI